MHFLHTTIDITNSPCRNVIGIRAVSAVGQTARRDCSSGDKWVNGLRILSETGFGGLF